MAQRLLRARREGLRPLVIGPRAMGALLGWLAAVLLVACDDALTQIMLVVDTDLDVPGEVDSVVIRVTGPSGREREASATFETTRPVTLALVPADVEAGGGVAIHVALRHEGDLVAERVATTSFVNGRVNQLGVCVERACTTSCPPLDAPGESLPRWSGSVVGSPCTSPADGGVDAGADGEMPPPVGTGHALVLRDIDGIGNRLHRVAIREGAELEDLSALLDMAIEPMEITDDRDASFSPDGRLIAASVSRGSCVGWSCVWLGPSDDPSAMRPIRVDIEPDALLHASWPVVADDARFVVYESAGATAEHHYDVWITHRGDGGDYGPPVVLSAASTRPYNKRPRLSPDQTRVVFSCSFEIYGYDSICEVGTDGTGFRILLSPDQAPPPYVALRDESLDHPSYAPDGSIVFATRWGVGSQIWRLPADGGLPERVHLADLHELTQPCVLPDGRIVAVHDLSAEAPGTTLAVLEPDGALAFEIAPTWVPGQYTWLTGCGP